MVQMPRISNLAFPQVADDQITLTWDRVTGSSWKYVVLMADGKSTKFVQYGDDSTYNNMIIKVNAGQDYRFNVYAKNDCGRSPSASI
jgi:hypothetical protein